MRTKGEILQDFEKLGFIVEENKERLTFYDGLTEDITFYKKDKTVKTSDWYHINMKELKLIYELCKFWRWFNED